MSELFTTKICPVCGREQCRSDFGDYVYRNGNKYYCSWKCFRKAQKEKKCEQKRTKNVPIDYGDKE